MNRLSSPGAPVRRALVLAAGNGDRFVHRSGQSKLLQRLHGQPLILRTLATARDAGVAAFHVVLGYQAEALRRLIVSGFTGADISFSYNPAWHLENGLSVLAARHQLADGPFALLMGDHLFEAAALARLLDSPRPPHASLLAVDSRPAPPAVAAEATKVQLAGSRIVAIGKDLTRFDALDTGMFVCSPRLFAALHEAARHGDTTLSGGVRSLAARGLMHAVDIGDAKWHDIDTVADLEAAEQRFARHAEYA